MEQELVDEIELTKKKVNYFFENNTIVHITYKNKKYLKWSRGSIVEVKADFFILDERMKGKMPVFFIEIDCIEPFRTKALKGEGEDGPN